MLLESGSDFNSINSTPEMSRREFEEKLYYIFHQLYEQDPDYQRVILRPLAIRVFPLVLVYDSKEWNDAKHYLLYLYKLFSELKLGNNKAGFDAYIVATANVAVATAAATVGAIETIAPTVAPTVAFVTHAVARVADTSMYNIIHQDIVRASELLLNNQITREEFLKAAIPPWPTEHFDKISQDDYIKEKIEAVIKLGDQHNIQHWADIRQVLLEIPETYKLWRLGEEQFSQQLTRHNYICKYIGDDKHSPEIPSKEDHLNRTKLVQAVVSKLLCPQNSDPFAIGLFGHWGIGKSSFIAQIKQKLLPEPEDTTQARCKFLIAEFNAWRYEKSDCVYAGLGQTIIDALADRPLPTQQSETTENEGIFTQKSNNKFVEQLKANIADQRRKDKFTQDILKILSTKYKIFGGLLASFYNLWSKPDYSKHAGKLPEMRRDIENLCGAFLQDENDRLLIIIDDLDRCSTNGVIAILEAIRIGLDINKVNVIVAVDERVALASLALHYQDLAKYYDDDHAAVTIARDYLAKIINMPITLAPPNANSVYGYLQALWQDDGKWQGDPMLFPQVKADSDNNANANAIAGSDFFDLPISPPSDNDVVEEKISIEELIAENNKAGSLPDKITVTNINEEKMIPELSYDQKVSFAKLTRSFAFYNPRQLKRLYNCYQYILKAYGDDDENYQKPYFANLTMLFAIEFVNSNRLKYDGLYDKFMSATVSGKLDYNNDENIDCDALKFFLEFFSQDKGAKMLADKNIYEAVQTCTLSSLA